MYTNKIITFLPSAMIEEMGSDVSNKMNENDTLKKIYFSVSASTTEDDLLEEYSIDIKDEKEFPDLVRQYIVRNIDVYCDGKYPEVAIRGYLIYLWENEYNRGDSATLEYHGYVWVYISQ